MDRGISKASVKMYCRRLGNRHDDYSVTKNQS